MSKVRRYYLETIIGNSCSIYEEKVDGLNDDATEMVLAKDHDRIVAEMQKRIEKLEAAMREIAKPTYGTELHNTDEERADIYWTHLSRFQIIAREALAGDAKGEP